MRTEALALLMTAGRPDQAALLDGYREAGNPLRPVRLSPLPKDVTIPNPPPIKTKAAFNEVEDAPQPVRYRMRRHSDDLALVDPNLIVHVGLRASWPKLAGVALAGYVVGALIHRR